MAIFFRAICLLCVRAYVLHWFYGIPADSRHCSMRLGSQLRSSLFNLIAELIFDSTCTYLGARASKTLVDECNGFSFMVISYHYYQNSYHYRANTRVVFRAPKLFVICVQLHGATSALGVNTNYGTLYYMDIKAPSCIHYYTAQ